MDPKEMMQIARHDPRRIIEGLFYIENKQGVVVPYTFNDVQNIVYNDCLRVKKTMTNWGRSFLDFLRIDILKARQQGFSSLILALFAVDFLVLPNLWSVCVSHEKDATRRLFRKVHLYLQRLPFVVPLNTSTTDMLINRLNGSVYYIGTAGSKTFGQGDTVHRLHLSELARYQDPERLVKNIIPSVPTDGTIFKETTANGMNNYHHRERVKEIEGKSIFVALFYGFNLTREYAIEPTKPPVFTVEEKEVMITHKLTIAQLYWRQLKIQELGSEDAFKQQFPLTELEAFVSSGISAFSKKSLEWYYTNVCRPPNIIGEFDESSSPIFQENPKGYMKIWEKPLPNSVYFITADIGKSGDFCAASVWHWGRLEQVATIHGHFEPDFFGTILYKLGAWYNYAQLIPENNGIGAGTVAALRLLNYQNLYCEKTITDMQTGEVKTDYGFNTNTKTRTLIITAGQKSIRERTPIIRDINHIIDMQSFQRNSEGKFEAAKSENGAQKDDRVMEFLIAMYYYQTNPMPEFSGFTQSNPIAQPDAPSGGSYGGAMETYDDFTS